jgi:DNA end-binding protein Ku
MNRTRSQPSTGRRHGKSFRRGPPARAAAPEAKAAEREEPRAGRRPKGVIWTGTISFGLVNIPVTMHSGETAKELHFSMLDKRDLSPVGYRKINKNTGADVAADQIVKGYRYGPDEYVTVTDEDFKRASPERTQRIDITAFVDAGKIDPAMFNRPYYLEPAAKSDKAYALLREAMRRSGKVGIASVVLRARQHLAALFVQGSVLTLELLRYRDELRDPSDLRLPEDDLGRLKITDSELEMAGRLVEDLSAPWRPEQYKDEYRDELLKFIEKKAQAGKTVPAPPGPSKSRPLAAPTDIMGLLKKSLAKGGR